jgi:inner membrane protein
MGWKWGGSQQITGPVMAIPYIKVGNNSQDVIYFLPDEYNVTGDIKPEERVRGIQKILNYQAEMKINGSFSFPDVESLGIKSSQVLWDKCFIMLGISNMQGIKNKIAINLDGKSYEVSPNIPQNSLIDKGLSVKIGLDPENPVVGKYDFDLTLNGTEGLYFLPVGKHTGIHLTSAWKSVGYIGDFVATENTDLSNGIDSKWDIFDYNRNFVQLWTGSNPNLEQSEIGADLLLPINHYEKTLRAVKYALMFIMLTFLVFFLIEFVGKKQIHPVQYLLVSLALVLFYTLLLAFSEHIGFDWSYLISSLATIVLITAYSSSIFRDKRQTTLMGVFLTVLYIYLYVVLQQENMALLFGAIGLFIGLACVMFVLRKVNWYRETITD